jgi:histidine triad (HIT) family protein
MWMVELSEDVKEQLEAQKQNCIFCKIINGDQDSKKVYEDSFMLGLLDINPWVEGHVLLMPKEHFPLMPFLPETTFKHMFGLMPKLVDALKNGMIATGANVFIANGGVAGQQSPHFLLHLIPRNDDDGKYNYLFEERKIFDETKQVTAEQNIHQRLLYYLSNHLKKEIEWKPQKPIDGVLYKDQKIEIRFAKKPQAIGHMVISIDDEILFEKISPNLSTHIFYCASFCASAIFEGAGVQGTNIILKAGVSADSPKGGISVHILPRSSEDELDVVFGPMPEKPDLDEISEKIKDKMFMLEYEQKHPKKMIIDAQFEDKVDKKFDNEIWDAIDKIIKE